MALKNTSLDYGSIAKAFHWVIALLIGAAWALIEYRHAFTTRGTPEFRTVLQLHMGIGISVGGLVLLRILWRLTNPSPLPVPGHPWEHTAAHLAHGALYAFMIGMPLTGYLGTGASTNFLGMFEIPKFAETGLFKWLVEERFGMTFKQFEGPIDFVHEQVGQFLIYFLVGGHVTVALFHHYVRKDFVLRRMLPRFRAEAGAAPIQ